MKVNKKKKEELEAKLKKQTDHFKIKQNEELLAKTTTEYELERATVASKLGEINKTFDSSRNAWLIGYLLSSLETFRQGFNFLQEREPDMSKQAAKKTRVTFLDVCFLFCLLDM